MVLPDKRCVNFYTSILQLCHERVVGTNKTSLIGLYTPRKLLIRYLYVIWVEWTVHYKTVRTVNLTEVSGVRLFWIWSWKVSINVKVSWKTAYPWSVEANFCYHTRHKEANQSYERCMQIEFFHSCSVSIYVTHFHGWGQDHLLGEEREKENFEYNNSLE